MQEGSKPRTVRQLVWRGQFARLFWAGAVSSLGDWISLFAAIALGNDLAGTLGITVPLLARFLPAVIFGAVAGVVADRFDAKAVMVVSDVGRIGLVSALVFVDTLQWLFIVTMLIEILSLIRQPAREAAMASVISKDELMNANSVTVFITYGMIPLAGVAWTVIAAVSEGVLGIDPWKVGYAIDALTFLVSALIILTLTLPVRETVAARQSGGFSLRAGLSDFVEGVRYVVRNPEIRIPILSIVWALVGAAPVFVLGEPFSREVLGLGSVGFGALATSIGVGAAVGVLAARFVERRGIDLPIGLAFALIAAGIGIIGIAFTDLLVTAVIGGFLSGFGTGAAYVIAFTTIHASVDDTLRGRAFATLYTLARMGVVVSLAAAPLLATALDGVLGGELADGVRLTMFISGVVVVSAGTVGIISWVRVRGRVA